MLAAPGSAAIEGQVMSWVDDHRKHHAFSTGRANRTARASTTVSGGGERCAAFVHAHVGWLFRHDQRGSRERYAPDMLADAVIRFVYRTFVRRAPGGLA